MPDGSGAGHSAEKPGDEGCASDPRQLPGRGRCLVRPAGGTRMRGGKFVLISAAGACGGCAAGNKLRGLDGDIQNLRERIAIWSLDKRCAEVIWHDAGHSPP